METLGKHFRAITEAAFKRYGFAQGDVVAHWAEIVGADLAQHSAPERIRWPRQAGEQAQMQGGTLIIRAAPGRALELQYEALRIIGRINSFFGYAAVTKLKVTQSATPFHTPPARPTLPEKPLCEQSLATVEDEALKAALSRLGRGVAGATRSSPQDK
jgi:hypothetical protein